MDVDALMDYKELGRHSSSPTPAASQFSGYGITILYFCFGGGGRTSAIATRVHSRAPFGPSPHLTRSIQ